MNASSGQMSGVPTQSGSVTISVQVTDSSSPLQTASKSYSVTISPGVSPVSITTSSLASGQVGTVYSMTVTATGGATPYSWSVTSGSLPNGLSLNSSSGQISGIPTQPGSFSFSVQVTDSSVPAQLASKSLTITIATGALLPLKLTTTTLPSGQVNVLYSATLSAQGGTTPYTWSLLTGSLPSGLSLSASNGQISGTPTQAGSFPIQIQVSDSSSPAQLASQSFTLLVNPPAPGTSITSCGTLANAGTTYVLQNDISSSGACITIGASAITLDLNGHTVTYDTGASGSVVGIDASTVTGFHLTSSVTGGTVAQSTACRINLATLANTAGLCASATPIQVHNGEVDHVFVYDYGLDNEAIEFGNGAFAGASVLVHDNTICPYHTKSVLTHYANYAEIRIQGSGPATINNNLIGIPVSAQYPNGCPTSWTDATGVALSHGYGFFGIQAQNWTSGTVAIHDNVISMAAPVRDAYGVAAECNTGNPSFTIYNNTINQYSGRGILAAGWSSGDPGCGTASIHDNHVTVKEAVNEGYTVGDPIGIQFRFGQHNSQIYNNTIAVNVGHGACPAQFFTDTGSDCNGIGIKLIGASNGNNQVYNNTIVADSNASSSLSSQCCWAQGLYGDGTSDSATSFSGNTVTSNSFNASVTDTDGCGSGWIFKNNTFIEDTNPQGYGTFRVVWFCNSGGPSNNILLDNAYQGGASPDNIGGSGSNPYSYFVKWSLNVSVKDALGNAVSAASVSAVSTGGGPETVTQSTDSSGNAQLILTDHAVSGTSAAAPSVVAYTPHTVTVSKTLCTTVSTSVQLKQTTPLPVTLTCR